MTGDAISIRSARESDIDTATAWLSDAGLPADDLTGNHMGAFLFATKDDVPVGMIGLEAFHDIGLLRSLYVATECRGHGLGYRLVDALESRAATTSINELWLLTVDAETFFGRLGYIVRAREDAPVVIRSTPEFSTLCPKDAALMCKAVQRVI